MIGRGPESRSERGGWKGRKRVLHTEVIRGNGRCKNGHTYGQVRVLIRV